MELWDIYDKDRNKTGRTMKRGEPMKDGDYHLVVHICIFSSDGKMLIQQRQPFKDGWSNLWDITVGGRWVAGVTRIDAAVREVREVVGIQLSPAELRKTMTIDFGHGFDDIARRIAALEEVESIFLMSGGYDLCCLVTDKSFQEVSMFVASRLSPMEDVVSTATHFILKKYKEQGMLFAQKNTDDRGNISL